MFSTAVVEGKKELVIKKDALQKKEAAAIETGRDDSLYRVTSLNHLRLSGFAGLHSISSKIGQISGLQQLILAENGLQSLPEEIASLGQLKMLDASRNQLHSLPRAVYGLSSLQSLLLGHNCLEDASFPVVQDKVFLPNLHHVDVSYNQLTLLPVMCYKLTDLLEIGAMDNAITVLDPDIGKLKSLKLLQLNSNKLTVLPSELANCMKLKTIDFEGNPLSDRRLLKLIVQHGSKKPRSVLEYIASRAPKSSDQEPKSKGGKKKSKAKDAEPKRLPSDSENDSEVEFSVTAKPIVTVSKPSPLVEVCATTLARKVRPYIVCAIVRGLDLTTANSFQDFITLQNKLHDGVCKRRRVATIATHDLARVSFPLTYACRPAEEVSLLPLGWAVRGTTTARGLLDHLEANRPSRNKKAKSLDASAAALSRYLEFINPQEMVFLMDSSNAVISLPPLTNSEHTKIGVGSSDLLLEVTSGESLSSCKGVMDALVLAMSEAGLQCRGSSGGLCVEQARVVDQEGKLLVLYPSRLDLNTDTVDVRRP